MERYFIPYHGEAPAALDINGHRVVLLAKEPGLLQQDLGRIGADRVQPLDEGEYATEEDVIHDLATRTKAHVVVTPTNVDLDELIATLARELPWVH